MRDVPTAQPLLEVRGLTVEFDQSGRWVPAVQDVSLEVGRGETVALVGESGSGKTVTAMAVLGLTERRGGRIAGGSIRLDGRELVGLPERELRAVRGNHVGMIFQQPIRSLNPAYTVGEQIAENVRAHLGLGRKAAWARAVEMLEMVHIPDAARRAQEYPHTFSGGMAQRIMIASAVACDPQMIIADEPTTALDVTVQARILQLLREIQERTGVSVLFISHDLGVVAEIADRVVVMYAGEVAEQGTCEEVFFDPLHPYTSGLLGSIPAVGNGRLLRTIAGRIPAPGEWSEGCRFEARCPHALAGVCDARHPATAARADGRAVRCSRVQELVLEGVVRP
ncbi:peptide/nickel transport system ATP-binding protein/oligopeptide transport system ATP-binding protein [Rhodococcus sp. OK519]|uniref:ABC transporter ATP-binding protein n=1 Tax=Rhodococcus sp. OK519 TaxID=2135729 RepID=UPI000D393AEE|nr:peptide/nickel transport system ATP-binding protein/oligopeptide transport system ATP-binding protein [Rhodococcus sp. OK519]